MLRAAAWPSLLAAGIAAVCVIAPLLAVIHGPELPWFAWIVVGPLLALWLPIGLLLTTSLFGVFRACLRPTSWRAVVAKDALILNLRSERNAHFGGDDPTVLHLDYHEIAGVRRVLETHTEEVGGESRHHRTRWIELGLKRTEDTEDIAIACMLEATRKPPSTRRFGITTSVRHHHITVCVPEAGVVRVAWDARLFRALESQLRVAPAARIDHDEAQAPPADTEQALQLLREGQPMAALRRLREAGFTLREAKAFLEDAAQPTP